MKKIGLTGTIGSGKSVVASVFSHLGVPVYYADQRARMIMDSEEMIAAVVSEFGEEILTEDRKINRKKLGSIVFREPSRLNFLNSLIHPKVKNDFDSWCEQHRQAPYIIHEAAILFESGFYKYFDKNITVYAPEELCIERVMNRDGLSRQEVLLRMSNQYPASQKVQLADYVIVNDEHQFLITQVLKLHRLFSGNT